MNATVTSSDSAGAMSSDLSGIVFYDGVCGFCNKFINWVVVRDRHRRLRFAPLQGATARKLIPQQYTQHLSTVVLHTDHGNYTHSAAVCRILFAIGGPWTLAAALLWLVPLPLRNLGYSLIGRVRYRLFGKLDQCRIPTADERSLFLD